LNQRDVIRVSGTGVTDRGEERFIEITHKYQIGAQGFVGDHPEQREMIERQIGQKLVETEILTILEFQPISKWQLEDAKE
jgi:hypothetical protein